MHLSTLYPSTVKNISRIEQNCEHLTPWKFFTRIIFNVKISQSTVVAYIHTYIHMHTYIHIYIHMYKHTYMHPCMQYLRLTPSCIQTIMCLTLKILVTDSSHFTCVCVLKGYYFSSLDADIVPCGTGSAPELWPSSLRWLTRYTLT